MASQEQIDQYHDQGYFIVDDALEPELLDELAVAARRAAAKVRSGEVIDDEEGIRTGGEGNDPEFVEGLLAPEFGEPAFAEYLGGEPLARYLRPFLGEEQRLGWVTLCCVRSDYQGAWHRDLGGTDRGASYEVEMELLARYRKNFMKWHLALVDDPCLWIVPGSQRRYRTERECQVLTSDSQGEIPGAQQIVLKQGQTMFWNGNSIHRGWKPEEVGERSTLMGALINHRAEYEASEKGDKRWMLADNIRDRLPERAKRYYDNWRSLAEPRMAGSNGE
jgi:hypothetical protein